MLMQRWNIAEYGLYFKTIRENDQKLREFLDYLTITFPSFSATLPSGPSFEKRYTPAGPVPGKKTAETVERGMRHRRRTLLPCHTLSRGELAAQSPCWQATLTRAQFP